LSRLTSVFPNGCSPKSASEEAISIYKLVAKAVHTNAMIRRFFIYNILFLYRFYFN